MDKMISTVFVFITVFVFVACQSSGDDKHKAKIAVIGGGIGGTATSYFLRKKFGKDVEIDLYEAKVIGGRVATVDMGEKSYDSGGTVIHPRNRYMVNFTDQLKLARKDSDLGSLSLYDGKDIVFDGSSWSWVMGAQLLWRYGMDMVRLAGLVSDVLKDFDRIYDHQMKNLAFTTPEKLLASMSPKFLDFLQVSTHDKLRTDGLGEKIIAELSMAGLRNNYGQTNNIQAFVGYVSLAGIEPGLWRVEGGNVQVPEKLIDKSRAKLIKERVTKVILNHSGPKKYEVVTEKQSESYDIVIVASPLSNQLSGINFENFPKPVGNFPQHYHRTVATFVKGQPNFPKFGYTTLHSFPNALLTIKDGIFFNSIGKQRAVNTRSTYKSKQELPVWKVFSQAPLTDSQLDDLFLSHEEVKVVDWMAYPDYKSTETDLPPFLLHKDLYYVNGIELCASAMEMSAIGAHNAALLAFNNWTGRDDLIDPDLYDKDFERDEL